AFELATTRSTLLSPSTSPMATEKGSPPVIKSTLVLKDDAAIIPGTEVLRNTDMVLAFLFGLTRSGFPSPSTSPMATKHGLLPVLKSTLPANDDELIAPATAVLRSTDRLLLLKL